MASPRRAYRWARENLFNGPVSSACTIIFTLLLGWLLVSIVEWAVIHAHFTVPQTAAGPDTSACRDDHAQGACWAVVGEKYRFILFGRYPFGQQWRPAAAILLLVALYVLSAQRWAWRRWLVLVWVGALTAIGVLMWGGLLGLGFVPQDEWGGLPLTLILSTFGIALAFPLAIFIALGRTARNLVLIRIFCTVYIELFRGMPLVALLFMSSVMFPLFMPPGLNIDKLLRAQIAIILFAAAYLAEVIRGGLQAVGQGQYEAADALGLSFGQKMRSIILPQALTYVVGPLVNIFIGLFKNTSLVLVIGLVDFLDAGKLAIAEPAWQPFGAEIYILLGAVYFVFCYAMSHYSRTVETQTNRGRGKPT